MPTTPSGAHLCIPTVSSSSDRVRPVHPGECATAKGVHGEAVLLCGLPPPSSTGTECLQIKAAVPGHSCWSPWSMAPSFPEPQTSLLGSAWLWLHASICRWPSPACVSQGVLCPSHRDTGQLEMGSQHKLWELSYPQEDSTCQSLPVLGSHGQELWGEEGPLPSPPWDCSATLPPTRRWQVASKRLNVEEGKHCLPHQGARSLSRLPEAHRMFSVRQ